MNPAVPGLHGRAPTVYVEMDERAVRLTLRSDPRERERLWHFGERARSKAMGRVSRIQLKGAPVLEAGDEVELAYTQACESIVTVTRDGALVFTSNEAAHWRTVYWSAWVNRVNRIRDEP